MDKFKEYTIGGYKRGIDDLKNVFVFRWVETGVDYGTNSIEEYKSEGSRLNFVFDCEMTEEAINKEIEGRKEWNENYIKGLKEEGRYREEYSVTIRMEYNSAFDGDMEELFNSKPLSYDFGTIDLWSYNKKDNWI